MEPRLTSLSHGGGCGCKIAPGVLSRDPAGHGRRCRSPRSCWSGIETSDDAAVWRLNDTQALVATTDFFMPIVDDPVRLRPDRRDQRHQRRLRHGRARRSWPSPSSACRSTCCRPQTIGRILAGGAVGLPATRASRSPAAIPSTRSSRSTAWWRSASSIPTTCAQRRARAGRRPRARQAARRRRDVGGAQEGRARRGRLCRDDRRRPRGSNTPGPDLAALRRASTR